MTRLPVICLMGPTAAGKTDVAMQLADAFDADIISVDSALVYRGMNIGTAKPSADIQRRYPHKLIDIRAPEESYSAGEFVRDARAAIADSRVAHRLPLLTGGTMLYFRSLIEGIADLPEADSATRLAIDSEAGQLGWPAMHDSLRQIDPQSAAKIDPNDAQRIQRGLEVFRLSGRPISAFHAEAQNVDNDHVYLKIALLPEPRAKLHARIDARLEQMLQAGFAEEVKSLMARPALTADHPAMRAVGYRQFWRCFDGEYDAVEARFRTLVATRQLAKRQFTWLRSESDLFAVNPLEVDATAAISEYLRAALESFSLCRKY